ncbi:MAG: DUF4185 domain-containing protein [Smithellaceae bacterium]
MKPVATFNQWPARMILLLCLSIFLASCGTLRSSPFASSCLPSFPDKDGWYGGDGAYSLALDQRRTLWLFGDSFVSPEAGQKDRVGMDLVTGNTLAISTCTENAQFNIHYYLKKKDGIFKPFFGKNEILWPQDPFIVEGVLYIPLLVIETVPESQPPFNFRIAGHIMAQIKDFSAEDPRVWPVTYRDWSQALASGIEALAPTAIVHRDHVYFYALFRHKKDNADTSGNILARINIHRLDQPAGALTYLHEDGTWRNILNASEVKIIFAAGLSELSVRYSAEHGRWQAVYLSPENRGRRLLYQSAPKPEGPWSEPAALIDPVAEIDPENSLYHPLTFCYAGKEHRQFSHNRNLVITYVCNSSETPDHAGSFLRNHLFLYRPVVKSVPVP